MAAGGAGWLCRWPGGELRPLSGGAWDPRLRAAGERPRQAQDTQSAAGALLPSGGNVSSSQGQFSSARSCLSFPVGHRHAPPTPGPSPGLHWPRCGSGSRPVPPRPPPRTVPTAPSPGWPGLSAEGWAMVRARQAGQNRHTPAGCLLTGRGLSGSTCPRPEPQFPHVLTARSSMSSVTASSASTCTEESAFTVTEPLLTVRRQGLSRPSPGVIPAPGRHPGVERLG